MTAERPLWGDIGAATYVDATSHLLDEQNGSLAHSILNQMTKGCPPEG
jgi:hypothetical protein